MDEFCPFCKSSLKSGATVCAACGATYYVPPKTNLVTALGIGFGIFGLLGLIGSHSEGRLVACGLFILFGAVMVLVDRNANKKTKPKWIRRIG